MDKKITKAMVLTAIETVVTGMKDFPEIVVDGVEISAQDILNYAGLAKTQLASKSDRAKAKAAEKKAEGDILRKAVEAVLTEMPMSIDEITSAVIAAGVEGYADDITRGKIVPRLTALEKMGVVRKETIKGADKRKISAYALKAVPEDSDEEFDEDVEDME